MRPDNYGEAEGVVVDSPSSPSPSLDYPGFILVRGVVILLQFSAQSIVVTQWQGTRKLATFWRKTFTLF